MLGDILLFCLAFYLTCTVAVYLALLQAVSVSVASSSDFLSASGPMCVQTEP